MIDILKEEFKRRMETECLTRILKCLEYLDEENVWYAPNKNVNSVGNLILHLSGNIKQYIQSTIGSKLDDRKRSIEFDSIKTHTKNQLSTLISDTIKNSVLVVSSVNKEDLSKIYHVQCFEESGLSIMIHVIEHTSYHTGQITQMTKWLQDVDTQYYSNLNLNKTQS